MRHTLQVFFWEYFGPMVIYPLFLVFREEIYGVAFVPQLAQEWAMYYWCFHYFKRIAETFLVHSFSHATMPVFNLFRNCSYYWVRLGGCGAYAGWMLDAGCCRAHRAADRDPRGKRAWMERRARVCFARTRNPLPVSLSQPTLRAPSTTLTTPQGFAACVSYFVNHPNFTSPDELRVRVAFACAMLCQVANLHTHLTLANLRKPGESAYKIPRCASHSLPHPKRGGWRCSVQRCDGRESERIGISGG
jgi:hypothetical protein